MKIKDLEKYPALAIARAIGCAPGTVRRYLQGKSKNEAKMRFEKEVSLLKETDILVKPRGRPWKKNSI